MKNLTLKAAATFALFALAACGGGNSSNQPPVVTPPPAGPSAPTSTSPAALLAYVAEDGTRVANANIDNNRMQRTQRSETVGGVRHTVTVDRMADGSYGLIQYVKGNDTTLYTVDNGLVASTSFPSGTYSGAMDVNYSADGGDTWNVGSGDMLISIDTVTGTANMGGMASTTGLTSSVEVFSTSNLVNGKFSDTAAVVRHREGGVEQGTYVGGVDGIMVGTGNDAGATGTLSANGPIFIMNGGFTTTKN